MGKEDNHRQETKLLKVEQAAKEYDAAELERLGLGRGEGVQGRAGLVADP